MGGGTAPVIAQTGFRSRDDTVTLNSATWTRAQNINWSQNVDTTFRLRLLLSDTAGATKTANYTFGLEFSIGGGAFNPVGASTAVQTTTSAQFGDDEVTTTSQITGGAGTFVQGRGDTNGAAPSSGNITLGNNHTECEFALRIDGAQVNNNDQIRIRATSTNAAPTQTPEITAVKVAATLEQVGYRGRNDNGSETGATWKADENTGWTQAVDEGFRVRFVIDETGAVGNEGNFNARLQYNLASAGWNDVTGASSVVRATGSPNVTDEGATTRQLTSGTGTFITGAIDEADGVAGSNNQIDFASGQLTEVEFCCAIQSADVTDEQTLQLRVVRSSGTVLEGYTQTPTITVSEVVGGTATQARFRIRDDDLQTVNADAGWADVTNADVSIPPEDDFRIRFGIESSGGVTQAYKLQSRHQPDGGSFGAWSDVIVEAGPEAASAQFAPTFIGPSVGLVDGAATTDLLGGTGTFVAGTGEEGGASGTNTTASIALAAGQRTEVEFHVRIHKWSDNRFFVATGDQFQYRLVNAADGTVLTYDQTPTVTVAQGDGVLGGTWIEGPSRIGPFKDSNGNLYAFFEYTETTPRLCMAKSTDGGTYWVDGTLVGRSDLTDMEAVDVRQDTANGILHIVNQGVNADNVYYFRYHTSDHATTPDSWAIIDELITLGADPIDQSVSLEPRADGTFVCFYTRVENSVDHVAYKIRAAGGGWGTENVIDAGGSIGYAQVESVTDENGVIWVFYKDTSVLYYRTLGDAATDPTGPGDVLSDRTALTGGDNFSSSSNRQPMRPPVHYMAGGDSVITVMWLHITTAPALQLHTIQIINGTPQTAQQVSDRQVIRDQGQSRQPVAYLAADGTTLHAVYADTTTLDMWHTSRDHGGSWAASTEIFDELTVHWVNAEVYTHSAGNGGAKVLGLVYDNGSAGFTGYGRYDELELGEPPITREIVDPIGIDEAAPTQTSAWSGVGIEPVGIDDTVEVDVTTSGEHTRTVTDPVGIEDTATQATDAARTIADAVGVTDSAAVPTGPLLGETDTSALPGAEFGEGHTRNAWWNSHAGRWDAILPAAAPPAAGASDWWLFTDIAAGTPTAELAVDTAAAVTPDVWWDDTGKTLYMLFGRAGGAASEGRFYRYTYDDVGDDYTNASGQVLTPLGIRGAQRPVIGRTPNGHLWIATSSDNDDAVKVARSTDDGDTWSSIVTLKSLPTSANGACHIVVWQDGGGTHRVGLAVTENGAVADSHLHFLHIDQDHAGWETPGNWTDETTSIPAHSGDEHADDEISAIVHDNTVYIATETEPGTNSRTTPDPQLVVYRRTQAGSWSKHVAREYNANGTEDHKRPVVTIDSDAGRVIVAAARNDREFVYLHHAPLTDLDSWVEEVVFTADPAGDLYNPRLPRFAVTSTTGLLVQVNETVAQVMWRDMATLTIPATATLTDPVGIADTADQASAAVRVETGPVGVTDVVAAEISQVRTPTDPVGVTDTATAEAGYTRTVTDPVGISDTADQAADHPRAVTDPVSITDAASSVAPVERTVTDAVGITEAGQTHTIDTVETVTDPVGATDTTETASTTARTVTDPLGIVDAVDVSAAGANTRTVIDQVGVTDTTTGASDAARAATDAVGIADQADRAADHAQVATDDLGIVDAASASTALPTTVTDDVGTTDTVEAGVAYTREVTDPVGLTDAEAVIAAAERIIADALAIEDTIPFLAPAYLAAFLETTRRWDRFTGTIRPDRFTETTRNDRFTTTARDWDRFRPTVRHDRFTGTIRFDRVTGTVRYQRFHTTAIYREDTDVALEIVPLGDFTQGEIPEGLLIQWVRTHNDGTTSGLPLHNQSPIFTVTGKLEQPSGAIVSRACAILDPATLSTQFPDEPQVAPFINGTHGWVLFQFDEGDLDELATDPATYEIALVASQATTPPLRLKTSDVWTLAVNDSPAAAVGA